MSGTIASSQLQKLVRDSLFVTGTVYEHLDNGELRYDGERPGEGWHAHGYFSCTVVMLKGGVPGARVLWKRRWVITDDGGRHTCHSRPPDVLPRVRFCLLFVVLKLWAWLDAEEGLHHYKEILDKLDDVGSRRSAQRWLRWLVPEGLEFQQTVRLAVIERCEPRPLETIFPGGLDPPERVRRRRWKDGLMVGRLWTALAMLFGASCDLKLSSSILLAEARRRWNDPKRDSM